MTASFGVAICLIENATHHCEGNIREHMTRLFQIILVGSNAVPLLTGLLATYLGAALFVPAEQITTDFDDKSVSMVSGFQGYSG